MKVKVTDLKPGQILYMKGNEVILVLGKNEKISPGFVVLTRLYKGIMQTYTYYPNSCFIVKKIFD